MNAVESFHTFAISHFSSPHPSATLNPPFLLCSFSPPNLHPPIFTPPFHFSSLFVSVPKPPLLSSHLSSPPIIGTLIQSHSSSHTASPAHKAPSHSFIVPVYCLFTATAQHKSIISPNGKSTLTWEDTPFPSQNARSTGTWASANADLGASRHSHFRWDSKVIPSGPGVPLGVNGVLTEDATTPIKMQITSQSRGWPGSALHKPG